MTEEMKNDAGNSSDNSWQITKGKLIREISATYEAIHKFAKHDVKSSDQLNAMSINDLSDELRHQTDLLDKLISKWDVKS